MTRMMIGLLAVATTFALVAGCGDDVVDSGEGGGGNAGANAGGDGGTGNVGGCATCGPEQQCVFCYSSGPPFNGCRDRDRPETGEFRCEWLACATGDVCLDIQPAGDGCPDAECAALPPACATTPTCECIQAEIGGYACEEDDMGNITVTGYFL